MTQDDPAETRPRSPGRPRLVVSGMVGACALGLSLGFWARPEMAPREPPRPRAPPMQAVLQIVVDDTPAPLGPLLEVLPQDAAPPVRMLGRRLPPQPTVQPFLQEERLVRVDAPQHAWSVLAPAVVDAPESLAPVRKPAPRPNVVETPAEKQKPATIAKARRPEPKPKLARAEPKPKLAKAEPKRAKSAKVEPKVKKKPAAKRVELAKVKPEPKKLAKPDRKKATELARAPSKPLKAAAKPTRRPPVEKAVVRKPPPKPQGEGPMRVARGAPCGSRDPGEAMVCSDRRLGARERQLQRVLREAEAAGVPASALRRQQARLVVTRAAAAREAPWAVEDVYEARISEVNDLIRDARDN